LPSGLKLVVHVGHLSAADSRVLARHAQDIGADAIAAIAPSFFKPASARELVAWCADVAAAAPQLPFYYYHMPAMTGVPIRAREFLAVALDRIPTLAGVKFTDEDLEDYAAARAFASNRYDILFGRDEILLSGLKLGAPGAVGSTYNYSAPLYHALIDAFCARDLDTAVRLQSRAQAFIDVFSRLGGLPAAKVIMKFIGVDCGPVRLPLRAITADEENTLRAGLEACGFFEYASRL
jgi:N-acetylneuraminate lyase